MIFFYFIFLKYVLAISYVFLDTKGYQLTVIKLFTFFYVNQCEQTFLYISVG